MRHRPWGYRDVKELTLREIGRARLIELDPHGLALAARPGEHGRTARRG